MDTRRGRAALCLGSWLFCCATPPPPRPPAGEPPSLPASPRQGRAEAARLALDAQLAGLPRCPPGAEVGELAVAAAACTRMACPEACCNRCTWTATFTSMDGVARPLEASRVASLLGLPERALDCEVAAWAELLRTRDLDLSRGCIVR